MQATWTMLADGEWGVRIEVAFGPLLDAVIGQEVEVTTRKGEVSMQKVIELVKYIAPRPAKRVRGRLIKAVEKPMAIFKVEKREKIRSAKPARSPRLSPVEYDLLRESALYGARQRQVAAVAAQLDEAGPLLTPRQYDRQVAQIRELSEHRATQARRDAGWAQVMEGEAAYLEREPETGRTEWTPELEASEAHREARKEALLESDAQYYGSEEDRQERLDDWASDVEWAC